MAPEKIKDLRAICLIYSAARRPARTLARIIHQAIWLYLRFTLSLRDVEDLLAERGIMVSYETVRRWVNHFGADDRGGPAQTPAQATHDLAFG